MGVVESFAGEVLALPLESVSPTPANDDRMALETRIDRLEAELQLERVRHEATKVLAGALLDEATAHPDRDGHPFANDQERIDALYGAAMIQAARRAGCQHLLYGSVAEYEVARNRDRMERDARMREARARILDLEQEILTLETRALELRELAWQDGLLPIRWAGLRRRAFRGRVYPSRAHAEMAKERHLTLLEDRRTGVLKKVEVLQKEIRRLHAVARGWASG